MPLVIQQTHTHCSILVLGKRMKKRGSTTYGCPNFAQSASGCSQQCHRLQQLVTPPQQNVLITAKLSHRSRASGGTGVEPVLRSIFSQQKRLLRAFSSAAAKPIHPANPTKYCEQFNCSTCMLRSGVTLRQTPLSGAVFQDLLRSHAVSSDIPNRAFSLRQGFVDCWLSVVFQL